MDCISARTAFCSAPCLIIRSTIFFAASRDIFSLLDMLRLKQLEIFPLLPLRDLRLVAGDLGLLDAKIVVDEIFAEAGGEAGILAQRGERLLEAFGQMRRLDFVRRVRRRGGGERSVHAREGG